MNIFDPHITGSLSVSASAHIEGDLTVLGTIEAGSFTGSFIGDGSQLTDVPASGVTGLSLDSISSGSNSLFMGANGFSK